MPPPPSLLQAIQRQSLQPAPAGLDRLADRLLERYGDAVQAMLFYGSCLRSGDVLDGLVDLYVIVSDYRRAYRRRTLSVANRLLPPNVFYLEVPTPHGVIRSKYAVLSMRDLQRGTSMGWFHSYFWGRFAQPVGLLYARDDPAARQVIGALAQAVLTFIARALPRLPAEFDAAELWQTGLALSYRCELRAEKSGRSAELVAAFRDYYEQLTQAAAAALPYTARTNSDTRPVRYRAEIPPATRRFSRLAWGTRRLQGKALSLLRLGKAVFTFRGGVDYIVWKLERHSGTSIEVPPRVRRYPLLWGWGLLWRLYRRGVFR